MTVGETFLAYACFLGAWMDGLGLTYLSLCCPIICFTIITFHHSFIYCHFIIGFSDVSLVILFHKSARNYCKSDPALSYSHEAESSRGILHLVEIQTPLTRRLNFTSLLTFRGHGKEAGILHVSLNFYISYMIDWLSSLYATNPGLPSNEAPVERLDTRLA